MEGRSGVRGEGKLRRGERGGRKGRGEGEGGREWIDGLRERECALNREGGGRERA